jgi:hypothetical protein
VGTARGVRSAFTNASIPTVSRSRYGADDVLPAPFGPPMTTTWGTWCSWERAGYLPPRTFLTLEAGPRWIRRFPDLSERGKSGDWGRKPDHQPSTRFSASAGGGRHHQWHRASGVVFRRQGPDQ